MEGNFDPHTRNGCDATGRAIAGDKEFKPQCLICFEDRVLRKRQPKFFATRITDHSLAGSLSPNQTGQQDEGQERGGTKTSNHFTTTKRALATRFAAPDAVK